MYYYKHRSDTDTIKYDTHNFHEKAYVHQRSTDNNIVYCIQSWDQLTGATGSDYEVFNNNVESTGLSNEDFERIKSIAYFGYGYKDTKYNHTDLKWYAITQKLIWEVQAPEIKHYIVDSISGKEEAKIDTTKEEKEILSLVEAYEKTLKFENFNNKVYVAQNKILKVTNGNLENYKVVSNNVNVSVKKEEKQITLSGINLGIEKIVFEKSASRIKKETQVYISKNYQNLISVGDLKKENYSLDVEIKGTFLTVMKYAETVTNIAKTDLNYLYNVQNLPLDGVKINLYASEAIYDGANNLLYSKDDLVMEIETGVNNKNIPLIPGKYYIKEIETVAGFVVNNNIVSRNLGIGAETMKIINQEQHLVFDFQKLKETSINNFIPGENIEFGLYADEDIYNYFGKLLAKKDDQIGVLETDGYGRVYEEFTLPYGKYYIKELNVAPEYEEFEFHFDFQYNNTNDATQILKINAENILTNPLKKKELKIIKKDANNKLLLAGVEFTIYDEFNNIIETLKTNIQGEITINLPIGKYFIQETQALDGYILDDTIYSVSINDNQILEIINSPEDVEVPKEPPVELDDPEKPIIEDDLEISGGPDNVVPPEIINNPEITIIVDVPATELNYIIYYQIILFSIGVLCLSKVFL